MDAPLPPRRTVISVSFSVSNPDAVAVAEALAATTPCPIEFVGVKDTFGASGEPEELAHHFGISAPFIADAARRAIARKKK